MTKNIKSPLSSEQDDLNISDQDQSSSDLVGSAVLLDSGDTQNNVEDKDYFSKDSEYYAEQHFEQTFAGNENITFAGQVGTSPINLEKPYKVSLLKKDDLETQDSLEFSKVEDQGETQANLSSDALPESSDDNSGVSSEIPMGIAAKCFKHMAGLGPLYLLLFFIIHMSASVWFPSIYSFAELQYLDIFQKMKQSGQWLIPPTSPTLGATFPGYYWFMTLVDFIPVPKHLFLPVLNSISAFIAICGVYTLGRCTKLENNGAFGGLLLIFSTPLFIVFLHSVGPQMLTAGFFCLALGLLFRAWTKESAPFSFIFGFTFTALATFTGGFLPLWTILIASVLLILWRLDIHRANKLDAVVGFGCMTLLFAAWLVLVILSSQHTDVLDSLMQQSLLPFLPPYWPLPMPWTLFLLVIGVIPWLLAPLFSPWLNVLQNSFKNIKASRKENSGPTWLYLVGIIGIMLIVFQKNSTFATSLSLLPVWVLIFAATICNFSKTGSNIFFLLVAIVLLVSGLALTSLSIPLTASYWTSYVPQQVVSFLQSLKHLPIVSGLFILSAALLVVFTKRIFAQGALLVLALCSIVITQGFVALVAPSMAGKYASFHNLDSGLEAIVLPKANTTPKTENAPAHTPVEPFLNVIVGVKFDSPKGQPTIVTSPPKTTTLQPSNNASNVTDKASPPAQNVNPTQQQVPSVPEDAPRTLPAPQSAQ